MQGACRRKNKKEIVLPATIVSYQIETIVAGRTNFFLFLFEYRYEDNEVSV